MAQRPRKPTPAAHSPYFEQAKLPLNALMLLLPFIVIYELGAWYYANAATGQRLSARWWLQEFLEMFGAVGEYLPGLAVVVILLAIHFAEGKPWRFRPSLYVFMLIESLALAIPLLLFSLLTGSSQVMVLAIGESGESWQAWMIFSIGAGIYEELVFRMCLIELVHLVAVSVIGFHERHGAWIAIVASAVVFGFSHFSADNPFSFGGLAFYLIAGFYFALIYLLRGFGIVAATHALYDIMVVALKFGLMPAR